MLKRSEIVERVNALVWEGLYTFDDIASDFDDAIAEINAELNATFPMMSEVLTDDDATYSRDVTVDEVTTDTPYFPEVYLRNFVVNFVVAAIFRREAEFGAEYYTAKENQDKWLGNMFRDYFSKVPEEFQDTESGMIEINPNTVEIE